MMQASSKACRSRTASREHRLDGIARRSQGGLWLATRRPARLVAQDSAALARIGRHCADLGRRGAAFRHQARVPAAAEHDTDGSRSDSPRLCRRLPADARRNADRICDRRRLRRAHRHRLLPRAGAARNDFPDFRRVADHSSDRLRRAGGAVVRQHPARQGGDRVLSHLLPRDGQHAARPRNRRSQTGGTDAQLWRIEPSVAAAPAASHRAAADLRGAAACLLAQPRRRDRRRMVRRHHRSWRTAAASYVHRERRRDLGRVAGRRTARHRLLCRRRRDRTTAGVLECRTMSLALRSPSLSVQRGILGALLLVLCWEGLARGLHLPSYILPAVSEILAGVWSKRALLSEAAGYTLIEALAGYGLGCLIGIGLAVAVTMRPALRGVILPAATAINSVPVVGYSPLILLWFGIGVVSKMVMVAMAVSFTVFLSTLAGLDRVDRRAVDLMRSFGAGRLAILWRLRLPTALQLLLAGMRVSTVRSVIVAIITEMLGAYGGLGWVIYQAVLQIDFVQVWSAIFVASAASLSFFGLIGLLERRILFWK